MIKVLAQLMHNLVRHLHRHCFCLPSFPIKPYIFMFETMGDFKFRLDLSFKL